MSTTVETARRVRYGVQAGDLLKMQMRCGERVVRSGPAGEPEVHESEQIFLINQTVAELTDATMLMESYVAGCALHRNGQTWEIAPAPEERRVLMYRNGAECEVEPGKPLPLFVFPDRELAPGDEWEATATMSVKHCEQVPVLLNCRVMEPEHPDVLHVQMRSDNLMLGDIVANVVGQVYFSLKQGCLILGAVANTQRRSDESGIQEWTQWLTMQLTERIGVEEFVNER